MSSPAKQPEQSKWIVENEDTETQEWIQKGERFAEVRLEKKGDPIPICDHPDLDFLEFNFQSECDRPDCARIFPGTFKYCPFCGKELRLDNRGREPGIAGWWESRSIGFPELPFAVELHAGGDEPAQPAMPPAEGLFAFMVAGKPPRLYAFDRNNCVLWVKGLLTDEWRQLHTLAHSQSLPSWSWAAAEGDSGFAAITQNGLFWVALPWHQGNSLQPLDLSPGKDHFLVLGGAGRSGLVVAVPLLKGKGLAIAWRHIAHNEAWYVLDEVSGWNNGGTTESGLKNLTSAYLGAPVQDARGSLYWAGMHGFLACEVAGGRPENARWIPWPPGHKGRPEYRPLRDIDGSVYQLTLDASKSQSFADKMSLVGGAGNRIDGPYFSSGHDSFYEYYYYPKQPWDGYTERDVFDVTRQNVFPLLALGGNHKTQTAQQLFYGRTTSALTEGYAANTRFQADVFFRGSDGVAMPFRRGFELSWPSDLTMFYFEERLYLYDSLVNNLWYWPAKPRI